jgi:hypothetical protein
MQNLLIRKSRRADLFDCGIVIFSRASGMITDAYLNSEYEEISTYADNKQDRCEYILSRMRVTRDENNGF